MDVNALIAATRHTAPFPIPTADQATAVLVCAIAALLSLSVLAQSHTNVFDARQKPVILAMGALVTLPWAMTALAFVRTTPTEAALFMPGAMSLALGVIVFQIATRRFRSDPFSRYGDITLGLLTALPFTAQLLA